MGDSEPMTEQSISADLLLRHARVLTMDPHRRILADGAVAIRAGRIAAVGRDSDLAARWQAAGVRDLRGALVHPGLVDAHAHTTSDLIRGFAPKTHPGWGPVEMAFYATTGSEADLLGTQLSTMEMVANGITTYCDTGGSLDLDATARAIESVGIRGIPGQRIFDVLAEPDLEGIVTSTGECLARLQAQIARYPFRGGGRVWCAATLSGMGLSSDRLLLEAQALAEAAGVPMVMHQSWSADEVAASEAATGRRPVQHLADIGLLGPNLTLVHMIHLDDDEVRLIAASGTRVVHCPAAAMRRGMGAIRVGRFPELVAAGVTVALGSDGFSGKRDLLRQAYLAAVGFREFRDEVPVFTGETVLEMATINGATALGLAAEIGSIEAGKRADIVIHGLDRPEAYPRFSDPVDSLVFYAGSSTVETVIVDGEAIYDARRFTRLDADEVYANVDQAARAFEESFGRGAFAAWPIVD